MDMTMAINPGRKEMLGIRIGTWSEVGADGGCWVPDLSMARWETPSVQLPAPVPMPMPEGARRGPQGPLGPC